MQRMLGRAEYVAYWTLLGALALLLWIRVGEPLWSSTPRGMGILYFIALFANHLFIEFSMSIPVIIIAMAVLSWRTLRHH